MIRLSALYIFVIFLCIYAWKDWFKSLCGLILLMAVIEHEDMPKTMFGIQGFNVWNILFLVIFLAWIASRRREGLTWDMPRHINVLLLMYLGVILFGFLRAAIDRSYIQDYTLGSLISEELINTVKWVLPAILLFDGCRTRKRVIMALVCLLVVYFLISVQVIKRIPLTALFQAGNAIGIMRRRCNDIGYSPPDMSVMLAGVSWGILATLPLVPKKYWVMMLAAAGIVVLGQALTGGRAGYLSWGATGLVLCLLKWRKYLILAPVIVVLLPIVFPGAVNRMLIGFDETDIAGQATIDDSSMTSGRLHMWPYVIDKIGESPWVGYGRMAMKRTGLSQHVGLELDDDTWPHPHNMYLETLLDNGILGSIPIFVFFGAMTVYSTRLFRSSNRLCSAVGGFALAAAFASLFAGITGQHFYPQEHTLGIWAAIFLMLRVYEEERRAQIGAISTESYWS